MGVFKLFLEILAVSVKEFLYFSSSEVEKRDLKSKTFRFLGDCN